MDQPFKLLKGPRGEAAIENPDYDRFGHRVHDFAEEEPECPPKRKPKPDVLTVPAIDEVRFQEGARYGLARIAEKISQNETLGFLYELVLKPIGQSIKSIASRLTPKMEIDPNYHS